MSVWLSVVPSSLQALTWARFSGLIRTVQVLSSGPGKQAVGREAACGNTIRVSLCSDAGFPPAVTDDTSLVKAPASWLLAQWWQRPKDALTVAAKHGLPDAVSTSG